MDMFSFRKEIGRKLFLSKVMNEWNKLDGYIVEVNMTETFTALEVKQIYG